MDGVFVAMLILVPVASVLLGTVTAGLGFSLRGSSGHHESFGVFVKSPEGVTSFLVGAKLAEAVVSVFLARASRAGAIARLALRPSRMTIGQYLTGALGVVLGGAAVHGTIKLVAELLHGTALEVDVTMGSSVVPGREELGWTIAFAIVVGLATPIAEETRTVNDPIRPYSSIAGWATFKMDLPAERRVPIN